MSFTSPKNGKGQKVKDLTEPFALEFKPQGGDTKCIYYDEDTKQFSTDGLTTEITDDAVVCKCTHATPFALGQVDSGGESKCPV